MHTNCHCAACTNRRLGGLQLMTALRELQPEAFEFHNSFEYGGSGGINGNSNEYVRWVQQSLNQILGLRLTKDGIAGPQTRSAIRSFQQRQGLTQDGIVGPQTEKALIDAGAVLLPGLSGTGKPSSVIKTPPSPSFNVTAPPQSFEPARVDPTDPRLDVSAKFSLQRMLKADPAARKDASEMMAAINTKRLAGIFGDDLRVSAELAKRLGTVRWELIPKGEDAALVLDPTGPPSIVFRGGQGKPPYDGIRRVPDRLDPAIRRAWASFLLLESGKLQPCATQNLSSSQQRKLGLQKQVVLNVIPRAFCTLSTPSDPLDLAVEQFKTTLSNNRLIKDGQFYWSSLMREALRFCEEARNTTNPKCVKLSGDEKRIATEPLANFLYDNLWKEYDESKGDRMKTRDEILDFFIRHREFPFTFQLLGFLRNVEKTRCFEVAGRVCKIIDKKGGLVNKTIEKKLCLSLDPTSLLIKLPPICLEPNTRCQLQHFDDEEEGEVLKYKPIMPNNIRDIKNALDVGYIIKTGVLSGFCLEKEGGDHTIVIIGYDGNKFIFWDPDANKSRFSRFGNGFGILHFFFNTGKGKEGFLFSTASDESELLVKSCGENNGEHVEPNLCDTASGECQKRYQVMSLLTVPTFCRQKR